MYTKLLDEYTFKLCMLKLKDQLCHQEIQGSIKRLEEIALKKDVYSGGVKYFD